MKQAGAPKSSNSRQKCGVVGQTFLNPRPMALESKENPVSITVVMNWAQTLKQ